MDSVSIRLFFIWRSITWLTARVLTSQDGDYELAGEYLEKRRPRHTNEVGHRWDGESSCVTGTRKCARLWRATSRDFDQLRRWSKAETWNGSRRKLLLTFIEPREQVSACGTCQIEDWNCCRVTTDTRDRHAGAPVDPRFMLAPAAAQVQGVIL